MGSAKEPEPGSFEHKVNFLVHRFEGEPGFSVLRVAWDAHRDPGRGVFTNQELCEAASSSDHLCSMSYQVAARVTREMVMLGGLSHVGGKRPKRYALTKVGARALGRMARWRGRFAIRGARA